MDLKFTYSIQWMSLWNITKSEVCMFFRDKLKLLAESFFSPERARLINLANNGSKLDVLRSIDDAEKELYRDKVEKGSTGDAL